MRASTAPSSAIPLRTEPFSSPSADLSWPDPPDATSPLRQRQCRPSRSHARPNGYVTHASVSTRAFPFRPSPRRIQGDADKTMEMNFNIVAVMSAAPVEHGPRRVIRHVAACLSMHARRAFPNEVPTLT
ncbi:hypothetical protein B0H16DRAFT_1719574 [Mycena metata]|uniref:Uncharacterized protein n=1 Tax=Mycena metata TaxID=1033252 RepID=A0AAD7JBZ9_9AGAR|nr:hypothetical protein B0H16DRAFT_1719574 [Mycena metata]